MKRLIFTLIFLCITINISYGIDFGLTQSQENVPLITSISLNISKDDKVYYPSSPMDFLQFPRSTNDAFKIGAAFLTNLVIHELGHAVVADYVGASKNRLDFFRRENGKFFLGMSYAEDVDDESVLPYTMGGEFAADLTFEHALRGMRKDQDTFYKALVFFSGVDFLWYCLYSYYLTGGDPSYDPVTLQEETGLSKDVIFSIALAKTMINTYRIFAGEDPVIPYFTLDKKSVMLNLSIPF